MSKVNLLDIYKENMKYSKEELQDLILVQKLSYAEIGRKYGIADTTVRRHAIKLNIQLEPRWKTLNDEYTPHNKGKRKTKNCIGCGVEFDLNTHYSQMFCCKLCEKSYKKEQYYLEYLNNQDRFCEVRNMTFVKPHILKEQNNICIICESEPYHNDKELIFILDHIDGNASNNKRDNLRMVCPNCDSQLSTYKSKNKNSARKERYLKNKL